jgi:transposase IS116/IS110/IS902 family protein/transposase
MNVYVGIDWSENKHDICFLNESGEVLRVLQIAHTVAGFRELDRARQSLGIEVHEAVVGLETAHNLLVDYLGDQAYPTPQQACAMSFEELKAFWRQHHHTHARSWPKIYARLHCDDPQPTPELVAVYAPLMLAQARILEQLVKGRSECLSRLGELYSQHPDHEIYDSLARTGALLAPALLAKLGDDRDRYPTPAVLQAVAGTCPVTQRSGKHRHVYFRAACDHESRRIVQQWARLTLEISPWAVAYYSFVRPHCKNDSDAIRRLAKRWLEVLWRLWVDRKPYDESQHLKQHALRRKAC